MGIVTGNLREELDTEDEDLFNRLSTDFEEVGNHVVSLELLGMFTTVARRQYKQRSRLSFDRRLRLDWGRSHNI